jgi:Apea-like HEPN
MNRAMAKDQPSTDDSLVLAATRLLDDLIPIVKTRCPEDEDQPLVISSWPRWVPELEMGLGTRRYKAVPMVITAEQQCAVRLVAQFREEGRDPVIALDRALVADPIVGPRIADESVLSFAAGGGAFQGPPLIQSLVDVALNGSPLTREAHEDLARRWVEELRRPSDRVTVVIALREFDASRLPITLEPGLVIDQLTEDEIAVALQLGGGVKSIALDERSVARTFAIKKEFESRLFTREVPPAEQPREQAARDDAEKRAGLVLPALRLFKAGNVSASATFQYTRGFGGGVRSVQGGIGPSFGWHAADPYQLNDEDITDFQAFWVAFKKVHNRRAIAPALRRFQFAADRALPDDEIVDLMIAAEALFLREMDEQYRGELSFRLSTRTASLLGKTLEERLRLFKFMRRAYDTRSVIVHGGVPKGDDLLGLAGEPVTIQVFADDLEGVLRDALKTAMLSLASGKPFPPDWSKLMFAGPPGRTDE